MFTAVSAFLWFPKSSSIWKVSNRVGEARVGAKFPFLAIFAVLPMAEEQGTIVGKIVRKCSKKIAINKKNKQTGRQAEPRNKEKTKLNPKDGEEIKKRKETQAFKCKHDKGKKSETLL